MSCLFFFRRIGVLRLDWVQRCQFEFEYFMSCSPVVISCLWISTCILRVCLIAESAKIWGSGFSTPCGSAHFNSAPAGMGNHTYKTGTIDHIA